MDTKQLLELEQTYNFTDFTNEDAFIFATTILEMIKKEKLKNVRIRVTRNEDIIFQYLMDGKVGEQWLDRKQQTVLKAQHSSLYVFYQQADYLYMANNENYAVCGGGFPLIENNTITGVFCVSGLSHEEDHDLIIQGLKAIKERRK